MEEIKKSPTVLEDSIWDEAYNQGFKEGYAAGVADGKKKEGENA